MVYALYFHNTFNIGFVMYGGGHSHGHTPLLPQGTSVTGFAGRAHTVP